MKYNITPDLSRFNPNDGMERGKPLIIEFFWYLTKMFFFLSSFPWPYRLKIGILRFFGAKVGDGVIIKPRVNIHFPWKLDIGNHSWIGEEVFILNFEKITIGNHVCISQRAFLCGGNHDYKDQTFKYRNGPIIIRDGAWIGAQTFIAANVEINENCVVTAASVVYQNQPENSICSGNPCDVKKERWGKK